MWIMALCVLPVTALSVRVWLSRPLTTLDRSLSRVDASLDA